MSAKGRVKLTAAWLAVLLLLASVAGCWVGDRSGPPLVVLSATPSDGGGLAAGDAIWIAFNLPVDASTLHPRLRISPACDLQVLVSGREVRVRPLSPQAGAVYTLRVDPEVRGLGGETLAEAFQITLAILPAGTAADPSVTGPGAGSGDHPQIAYPIGAVLYLEGMAVGACDLPGSYEVPRFDSLRLHFSGPLATLLPSGSSPAVLSLERDGTTRLVPASLQTGADWFELALQEELRPGSAYECVLWTGAGSSDPVLVQLWQITVRGSAWTQVWSLDLQASRTSPVAQLDLGYELEYLLGCGPGVLAVGRPGGSTWQGLQIVQYLAIGAAGLEPLGQPAAVLRDANNLPAQVNQELELLVAVGPEVVPPLVGMRAWSGFLPVGELTGSEDNDGAAVIAVGAGRTMTLLDGVERDGQFVSGPALRDDGNALAYVARQYGSMLTLRLLRQDLAPGWQEPASSGISAADLLPVEMARSVLEVEYVGQLGYGGSAVWAGDDSVWWDVCLPDGASELWRVEGRGGQRELLGSGLAMSQVSPDGQLMVVRSTNGVAIYQATGPQAGNLIRSAKARFAGVTWLPDSSGVLLAGDDGIILVPVSGSTRRLTTFPARPGFFGGAGDGSEYWFVSDRRL